MLKKPGVLFSSHTLCRSRASAPPIPKTSSSRPAGPGQQQQQWEQRCTYAMVSDGHSTHDHGKLRWPEVTSVNAIPTPYQIFNQKKGSPYSKQRFYELVKLYHPDKHDINSLHDISYETKLERYRLIVAANDILSDPVKRGGYDCYGAGWNGSPDVLSPRDSQEGRGQGRAWGGVYNGRGWGGGSTGPSQNATWEDWERWYQKDAKGPQEPKFVSNSAFVGLILLFAIIGGIGQAHRAGSNGLAFLEQHENLHKNISRELMRVRKESRTAYSNREERIHSFLKQRDPHGHGPIHPKGESYRKLRPEHEVCSSGDVKGRRMDIYDKQGNPKEG